MTSCYSFIAGTGSAFPRHRRTNAELATMVDTDDQWVFERTGIRARRISDGTPSESCSHLGYQAALNAIEMAGISASDISHIIFATVSPDHIMPNASALVQEKLGAHQASALDISAACSGFVYGLGIADSFIRGGMGNHVLVIGAEVLSSIVNWQDRTTCILFGDGAGAAIISKTTDSKSKILSTHLKADGRLNDLLNVPGGGSLMPVTADILASGLNKVHMKGKEIFKVAVRSLSDCSMEALEKNNCTIKDVDWVVAHQANLRILETVAKRLEIPMEKFILNIEEHGNTSSATVPTALDQGVREGKVKRGDLVLMTTFGAGLTFGSALVRF